MIWILLIVYVACGVPVSRRFAWLVSQSTALRLPETVPHTWFDEPVCATCGGMFRYHRGGQSRILRSANFRACNTFVPGGEHGKRYPAMVVPRWHLVTGLAAVVSLALWPLALLAVGVVWLGPRYLVPVESRTERYARVAAELKAFETETDRRLREAGVVL